MDKKRIFVSATTRDLGSYRELASKTLRERGYEVVYQPDFNLTCQEIAEKLKHRIAECDAVVCLIGLLYGGEPSQRPPDQPRRSYTQWEYFLARELGKPVYLLLADKTTKFDEHEKDADELRQLQETYRAEVIRDRDWRSFANTDQLRAELALLRFPWEGPPPDHKPNNLPLASIGTLFKGREPFLDDLKERLGVPDGRATAIVNRLAVHGLGGVGKTRVAVEYAWRFADDYTAILFVSAPSPAELRANLANLAGVLGTSAVTASVDEQMAQVLDWLEEHPGWLLIIDNVDTVEAVHEVEDRLARLRAGHVLITSRIGNWSAAVERLDLDVLAPEAAAAFLRERAKLRRKQADDAVQAAAIARELDGLALALEQAGAYIDKQRLSFAEYLRRWEAKRPEVLRWHDLHLMHYPASVAVTWETTLALLMEPERRLLEVLAWLAPQPIPLFLFEAGPLTEAIPDPRQALAGLAGYSLARFDASGDAVLVHRLVQEITRGRTAEADRTATLQVALDAVNAVASVDAIDVRTWDTWTPLAAHADTVSRYADTARITAPTTRLMNQLGRYWQARGQFRTAEPLMRRALDIDELSYGAQHPIVAIRLNNLAQLLQDTNRLDQAEPLMQRVVTILEASLGPDHPNVGTALNNLAQLLQATNRLDQAEPLMRRALDIDELSYGAQHPNVARDLNNLAQLLKDTNRLDQAEPLMRRALDIDELSYGAQHPRVAIRLNNLAQLLKDTNRLDQAEPLMRRALDIDELSYGAQHPTVARDLNNLALLLQATNRLDQAEPLMRRALDIDELSYGAQHPTVARDLNNLALLLQATNRLDQAEPLMRRALDIDELSCGAQHPNVAIRLNNLALLLKDTNRLDQAEPLMRRALDIDELSYGAQHPNVARDLNNLAFLLMDTDRLEEAAPLFRRAIQIRLESERRTGFEHPRTRDNLDNYRDVLQSLGKTSDEIEQHLRELAESPGSEDS